MLVPNQTRLYTSGSWDHCSKVQYIHHVYVDSNNHTQHFTQSHICLNYLGHYNPAEFFPVILNYKHIDILPNFYFPVKLLENNSKKLQYIKENIMSESHWKSLSTISVWVGISARTSLLAFCWSNSPFEKTFWNAKVHEENWDMNHVYLTFI